MNDTDKINAKLEQIEAQSRREWWQTTSSIWEPSREARVIAALRIALEYINAVYKGKPTPNPSGIVLRNVAKALEGKT